HRFANLAECETVVFLRERLLNPLDRLHEGFVAQSKRLMVHWYDQPRAGRVGHRHSLLRCAVIVDPRVVCTDRHDGCIEGTVAPVTLERGRDRRIASNENPSSLAFNHPAGVSAPGVATNACAPVLDLDGANEDVTSRRGHCGGFIPTQLHHRRIVPAWKKV